MCTLLPQAGEQVNLVPHNSQFVCNSSKLTSSLLLVYRYSISSEYAAPIPV